MDHVDHIAELLDSFIETDNDWSEYDYSPTVETAVGHLAALPNTFTSVYRISEDRLILEYEPNMQWYEQFDPLTHNKFVNSAIARERGSLHFKASESDGSKTIWLYYRWIPTDKALDDRYLLVAAISKDSITIPLSLWVSVGQWISMGVTFILNIWLVIILSQSNPHHKTKRDRRRGIYDRH
jgi:hypothetical protein